MIMPNTANNEIEKVSNRFIFFANSECHGSSPLYEYLSLNIAKDEEILQLVLHTQYHLPLPNILFGAVHYLLLKNTEHPLADFYPTIKGSSAKKFSENTYSLFRNFCFEYENDIKSLISNRRVQTNEVLRSSCLFPGFSYISYLTNSNPLGIIEIGSSAGFNLVWDKYCYDYGLDFRYGELKSPLTLQCAFKYGKIPYLARTNLSVDFRLGIDLNPLNIFNIDDVDWLKALIWPEHLNRFMRLLQVINILRENPPTIIAGDALQLLPEVLSKVPNNLSLVIFHTFTFYQLSKSQREEFITLITNESRKRDIFVLSIMSLHEGGAKLQLDIYIKGNREVIDLAYCHSHGEWIEWIK